MTFRSFLKSIIFMSQPSVAALNTITLNYPRDMMTTADHSLKGWAKMQHCFDFFFFSKFELAFPVSALSYDQTFAIKKYFDLHFILFLVIGYIVYVSCCIYNFT